MYFNADLPARVTFTLAPLKHIASVWSFFKLCAQDPEDASLKNVGKDWASCL